MLFSSDIKSDLLILEGILFDVVTDSGDPSDPVVLGIVDTYFCKTGDLN